MAVRSWKINALLMQFHTNKRPRGGALTLLPLCFVQRNLCAPWLGTINFPSLALLHSVRRHFAPLCVNVCGVCVCVYIPVLRHIMASQHG